MYTITAELQIDSPDIDKVYGKANLSMRYVTAIDLAQRGGYALRGQFFKYSRIDKNGNAKIVYDHATVTTVVMSYSVELTNKTTSRGVIAVGPGTSIDKLKNLGKLGTIPLFPNEGITGKEHINLSNQVEFTFTWRVKSDKTHPSGMAVIAAIDHEHERDLFEAVKEEFSAKSIEKAENIHHYPNSYYSIALLLAMLSKDLETKTIGGAYWRNMPEDEKKLKGVTFLIKGRGIGNGIAILPDKFNYIGPVDGLVLIVDPEGEPRMMHVLGDYENVTEGVRDFMLKQADSLEALASAYRIIANKRGD
jgi:hypothetical protein